MGHARFWRKQSQCSISSHPSVTSHISGENSCDCFTSQHHSVTSQISGENSHKVPHHTHTPTHPRTTQLPRSSLDRAFPILATHPRKTQLPRMSLVETVTLFHILAPLCYVAQPLWKQSQQYTSSHRLVTSHISGANSDDVSHSRFASWHPLVTSNISGANSDNVPHSRYTSSHTHLPHTTLVLTVTTPYILARHPRIA